MAPVGLVFMFITTGIYALFCFDGGVRSVPISRSSIINIASSFIEKLSLAVSLDLDLVGDL